VNAGVLAHGQMSAPDVADGDGTLTDAVDLEGAREGSTFVPGTNVEDVTMPWIAEEIDHMEDALVVHGHLRLDALVRNPQTFHVARLLLFRRASSGGAGRHRCFLGAEASAGDQ